MKYVTVEDIIVSFPRPILPMIKDKPDYQTIHTIQKLLQANARAIDTYLGGGALWNLSLIFLDASYAMVAP
jgi:phage gp36-like protein